MAARLRTGLTAASVPGGNRRAVSFRNLLHRLLARASAPGPGRNILRFFHRDFSTALTGSLPSPGISTLSIPSSANSATFFLIVRLRGAGEESCSVPGTSAAVWGFTGASAATWFCRNTFLGAGSGETCSGVKSGGYRLEKKLNCNNRRLLKDNSVNQAAQGFLPLHRNWRRRSAHHHSRPALHTGTGRPSPFPDH